MLLQVNLTTITPLSRGSKKLLITEGIEQVANKWCWAACAEMILKYRNKIPNNLTPQQAQCQIATQFLKRFDSNINCCSNIDSCNTGLTKELILDLYTNNPYSLNPVLKNNPLTFNEVKTEIDTNRLIEIITDEPGIGLHASVIYGYNDTDATNLRVYVQKPGYSFDGSKTFDEVSTNWKYTLINL